MSSSVSEDQDQRSNGGLEDLTTMTIESLRARLLSERAISKTARQRADELTKRVLELEDQLKMVFLQKKRAEKATADVLAILESNGVTDASEEFDSNSDGETTISDSKISNHSVKMKGASTDFDARRHNREVSSSSEIDSSPSIGRSLSWKSSKDSSNYVERKKFMDSGRRRSSNFASSSSLPKRVGKSCRRIRRRETRSMAEEVQGDSNLNNNHVDRVDTCSQDLPDSHDIGTETTRDDPESHEVENPREAPSSRFCGTVIPEVSVSSRTEQDISMGRALHDQAQKKAHEEEKTAQREWEENVRENNSSALDSCDPGNRSDVTEERDEMKAPPQMYSVGGTNYLNQGTEVEVANTTFIADHKPKAPNSFLAAQQVDTRNLQGPNSSSMVPHETQLSEFAFPMSNGTPCKNLSGDSHSGPASTSYIRSLANGSSGDPLGYVPLPYANNGESSENRKELALMTQNSSSNLDTVLEALQEAKLSLRDKLNNVAPTVVGSSGRGIEHFVPAARSRDGLEIPVGCPGIFRLPTDFQFERTKANYLGSDPALSLSYQGSETTCNKLMPNPYVDARSSVLVNDRFWSSSGPSFMEIRSGIGMGTSPLTERVSETRTHPIPFTENLPGIPARRPLFEPVMGASFSGRNVYIDPRSGPGLPPPSSNYTYPTYPTYPDTRPQLPSGERFSRNSTMEFGMPSTDRFSLYDDHIRPNMYK